MSVFKLVWNEISRTEWQAGSESRLYKIIQASSNKAFHVEWWSCGFRVKILGTGKTLIWAKEIARGHFVEHQEGR